MPTALRDRVFVDGREILPPLPVPAAYKDPPPLDAPPPIPPQYLPQPPIRLSPQPPTDTIPQKRLDQLRRDIDRNFRDEKPVKPQPIVPIRPDPPTRRPRSIRDFDPPPIAPQPIRPSRPILPPLPPVRLSAVTIVRQDDAPREPAEDTFAASGGFYGSPTISPGAT